MTKHKPVKRRDLALRTLTIPNIMEINTRRAKAWHGKRGILGWSTLEWAGAMAGEAGEAANVAKKIKRIDEKLLGNAKRPAKGRRSHHYNRDLYVKKLAEECADVMMYTMLLAARENIDLETAVVRKFNQVSRRYGFVERLPA